MFLFNWGQGIDLGAEVTGIWYKFDGMVPLLLVWQLVEGLLGENISEFLVQFGHYVFETCQGGTS